MSIKHTVQNSEKCLQYSVDRRDLLGNSGLCINDYVCNNKKKKWLGYVLVFYSQISVEVNKDN